MLRPTPLEIASCVVVGIAGPGLCVRRPAEPVSEGSATVAHPTASPPLGALQDAILPALRRPPCVVSFSGGLDSSFILAVATDLARTTGLPAPIPCTWRFEGAPRAEESAWQERVMASLHLRDWVRLQAGDDLDLVGPVAQGVLRRHGVLHPVNAHLHLPIIETAAGGSVLTGAGGDQILSGWRPAPPGWTSSAKNALPSGVRAIARIRRHGDQFPWLHSNLSRRVLRHQMREIGLEPKRLDRRVAWHATRRDLVMTGASLATLAGENHVQLVNPFLAPRFVATLAQMLGARRAIPRPQVLEAVASGTLSALTYARRPKARFLEVFLRSPTRDLVTSWDGSGVDSRLVDIRTLQRLWSKWPIPPATAGLVQLVWSSAHGSENPSPGSPGVAAIVAAEIEARQ